MNPPAGKQEFGCVALLLLYIGSLHPASALSSENGPMFRSSNDSNYSGEAVDETLATPIQTAVDIDAQAVETSRYNAKKNNVQADFVDGNVAAIEAADVVVANILSGPLKVLAPLLSRLVRHAEASYVLIRLTFDESQVSSLVHDLGEINYPALTQTHAYFLI